MTEPESGLAAAAGGAPGDIERVEALHGARDRILQELRKTIVGQQEAIDLLLIALFARGHCLFVGVPGLAKTLLVQSMAQTLNLKFNRIQFTPDLMPSDITGTEILEEDRATGRRVFQFLKGPVFANILLADEVNRTPPKTQAALLQSMQEYQVTAGGKTHPLPLPFLVLATQNPIEQEGTYPLPEAQLDRFMLQVVVDYPPYDDEVEIVRRTTMGKAAEPSPILSPDEIMAFQALVRRVPVADHVIRYAVSLVRATRPDRPEAPAIVKSHIAWGAGPRASQNLILGAKARAILDGRFAAEVSDIRALAGPVLRHRLVPNFQAEAEGVGSAEIIAALLADPALKGSA